MIANREDGTLFCEFLVVAILCVCVCAREGELCG